MDATLPAWFTYIVSLAVGLIFGSFVNVCVVRLPNEKSIVRPGSCCPRCLQPIHWYDNIPIISYVLLGGRCRTCRESISIRYPLIELLTAVLFLAARHRWGWTPILFLKSLPFLCILVTITFIDLEHRIIPDVLSLGGLVLGIVLGVFEGRFMSAIAGSVFGFGLFYLMALIYEKSTGRSGLGGGDVKLLAMIGAFLGIGGVFAAVLISSVLGSVVGVLWAVLTKKSQVMQVAIPYGPFLVIGGLYYYFLGDVLWFQFMIPT